MQPEKEKQETKGGRRTAQKAEDIVRFSLRYPKMEKNKQNLHSNCAMSGPERVNELLFKHIET